MPRVITHITDVDAQEDAIADFVNKSTGLKCYFEGFSFKRERPYALANLITSRKEGKPWTKKELVSGITTTYYQDGFLTFDIDFFTDAYKADGTYLKENSRFYANKFVDNYHIAENKAQLAAQNIKVSLISQVVTNASIKEDDKWIKQSTVECVFNYRHEFKITDSDTFDTVDAPTITISE